MAFNFSDCVKLKRFHSEAVFDDRFVPLAHAFSQVNTKDLNIDATLVISERVVSLFQQSGGGLLFAFPFLRFVAPELLGYNLIKNAAQKVSRTVRVRPSPWASQ